MHKSNESRNYNKILIYTKPCITPSIFLTLKTAIQGDFLKYFFMQEKTNANN